MSLSQEQNIPTTRVNRVIPRSIAIVTFSLGFLLIGICRSAANETPTLSSTHQLDMQFQQLVKKLSHSLVAVQVASRTSPFQSEVSPKTAVGSSQPIYLRNVTALAVDSGGYLICAAALLSNQDSLWLIRDGKRYAVERIGIDFRSGLALLKTNAPNLCSATYVPNPSSTGALSLFLKATGSESVEPTLAIASGASSVDGYLEFSGPVGSGTVGGAFFNMDGQFLGLALGSLSASGSSNRVFVLPASRIEPIVTRLKCCGDREAGYLGVQVVGTIIRGLNPNASSSYGSAKLSTEDLVHFASDNDCSETTQIEPVTDNVTQGALITVVENGSPANKAGLLVGDVVYKYDNQAVESANAFRDYVRGCAPDSIISLNLLRGNQQRKISVRLADAPLNDATPMKIRSYEAPAIKTKQGDYSALLKRIEELEQRLRDLEGQR